MANDGTYENVFALPGGVTLSLDAEGDNSDFYADNKKFFTSYANNGYSGDLEMAKIIETFLTNVMGQTKDENGGITENVNDIDKYFALMYEVDGDETPTRYVFYKCKASRPNTEAETQNENGKTPKTETLKITASEDNNGDVKSYLEKNDTNTTAYNSFFETVYGRKTASV